MEELFSKLSLDTVKEEKQAIREKVWANLEEKRLVRKYPPSCHGKIPNFKGSQFATKKVTKLHEFKSAKAIKVNPSLAQMDLRHEIMKDNKLLIVPSPALNEYQGAQNAEEDINFCYLLDGSKLQEKDKKSAMTKKGSIRLGLPLDTDWSECPHLDIVVVGSVAVTKSGRRLGKGLGFAEIEWAILYELGVVDQSTIVITTVHDEQIVSEDIFHQNLCTNHDLPVDIIVTPRRIINVRPKLSKPSCGILWDKLVGTHLENLAIVGKLKK